jgi:Peptidase A4 family
VHIKRSSRIWWFAVRTGMAVTAGIGALTVLVVGFSPARSAAPVVRLLPGHLLGTATSRARGSTAASTSSPCWASSNWSGYAVSETAPAGLSCVPASGTAYTGVAGTWVVPTVTGSRQSTYSAAWAGIDGFANSDLIQAGTEQDYTGRSAHYSAWWEILPAAETVIPSITVKPGDTITVSIAKVSAGQWSITLTDKGSTVHAAQPPFTTTQSYSGPGTSAEWILEAPTVNGRQATLASYGSTAFDPDAANGAAPGLAAGSGGELVQGSFFRSQVVSIPSGPDTGPAPADGFAIAYGSNAPPAPSS